MGQDEEARRAKAKRLREQIRDIVGPGKAATGPDADRPKEGKAEEAKPRKGAGKESPRNFIHRRMRELAETEKND